jgi:hypothetical protein
VGEGNGYGDDRIDEIDLETNSDCEDEPEDYSTPQSLDEQANIGQNDDISSDLSPAAISEPSPKPISSESSSFRAETPSSMFSEPSQRRLRVGRTLISPE